MYDAFDISFEVNGIDWNGRVFQKYQELEMYFEVHLYAPDKRQSNNIVFIEMNNSGEWVQKNGITSTLQISSEFIEGIGKAIEGHYV